MAPSTLSPKTTFQHLFSLPVIVAALGYFVDIYDLQLFGIVRIPSLLSLGLTAEEADAIGITILDYQMIGLLLGGLFWGMLGDKKAGFRFCLALLSPTRRLISCVVLSPNSIFWIKSRPINGCDL